MEANDRRRDLPAVECELRLRTVGSTNAVARRLVEALPADLELPETLVSAVEQTAGRGRVGRQWASPPDAGLYVTLARRWPDSGTLGLLPLAVAVGLCDAIRAAGVSGCGVKWPNDLVVGERKIGGILIEVVARAGFPVALIGFGVNLTTPGGTLEALAATSIEREGGQWEPERCLDVCVAGVRRELEAVDRRGELVERYRQRMVHRRGDRLVWLHGDAVIEGSFRGIDAQGRLELETATGLRSVGAGEMIEA